MVGFRAEHDNIESRRAIAVLHRHREMVQAAHVQRGIGINVFIAHGTSGENGVME